MARAVLLAFVCLSLGSTPIVSQQGSQNNQSCTTPNRRPGNCILLRQCQPLLSIQMNQPPMTAAAARFLRQSQCGSVGRHPLVCCNTVNPPTNLLNPWVDQNPSTTTEKPTSPPEVRPAPRIGDQPGTSSTLSSVVSHRNLNLLPRDTCGIEFGQRISGGNTTDMDEFPWTALLQYIVRSGGKRFLCGGTLISKRYVLTAAHCMSRNSLGLKLVAVRLGEYNTETAQDCEDDLATGDRVCTDPPRDYGIKTVISHPGYKESQYHHDIALLRLDEDVPNTDYIRPICIPVQDDIRSKLYVGTELTVAGWGLTENGSASALKRKVNLPVVSNEECQRMYSSHETIIIPGQLCTGGEDGKNACRGESGGPLMSVDFMSTDNTLRFHVTGLVSFRIGICGEEGMPVVYTRVSEYVPWILDQMTP